MLRRSASRVFGFKLPRPPVEFRKPKSPHSSLSKGGEGDLFRASTSRARCENVAEMGLSIELRSLQFLVDIIEKKPKWDGGHGLP